MMRNRTLHNRSKGFTLVEVIVTIIAAGILGAIFINFMGTALNASWNSVEIARDETGGEAVVERIIADYVEEMNSDPAGALATIRANHLGGQYGNDVTMQYINFNSSGAEVVTEPTPSDNVKVVFQATGTGTPAITGRYPLTTILTRSRGENEDHFILF